MYDIPSTVIAYWSSTRQTKQTPSGWISGNAPCCIHRGQSPDTKKRGGIIHTQSNGFNYHCFNCHFKAGWTPGHNISKNTKNLLQWIGIPQEDISKIILQTVQYKFDISKQNIIIPIINPEFDEKPLPKNSLPILEWLNKLPNNKNLHNIIDYIINVRKLELDWYNWHWSPEKDYYDRLIIPFYHKNKIVGYTGRTIIPNKKPKYLTHSQPNYLFNLDTQKDYNKKFAIVVEGQIDAIAINGIAIMHNEPNESQIAQINALNKEIIVVPDKDKAGAKLLEAAIDNNWSVSLPPFNDKHNIKDVADAVKQYGRIYTLMSILKYKETNTTKIKILQKKLENVNKL